MIFFLFILFEIYNYLKIYYVNVLKYIYLIYYFIENIILIIVLIIVKLYEYII